MTEEENCLHQRRINVLDGDITRRLMKLKKKSDKHYTYRYNNDHCTTVQNVHMEFLCAGANLIRTNTRHATVPYLKNDCGFDFEKCTSTIVNAAKIALRAVEVYNDDNDNPWGPAQVVGCCGHFKYLSDRLQNEDLKDAHLHRIRTLIHSGVRIISLEGVQHINEAFMLLDIIREFPNVRVLIMFDSGSNTADKMELLRYDVMQCYHKLAKQIFAVGILGEDPVLARQQLYAINRLRPFQNLIPLIACIDNNRNDTEWMPVAVDTDNPKIEWEALGLRYVGGCNNVFMDDIKRIRSKLSHGQLWAS